MDMESVRRAVAISAASVLAVLPGCRAASSSARVAEPNATQASATQDRAACHIELPDAQVAIAQIADGVVLTYSTEPNRVGGLRDAIRRYVEWQNRPRSVVDRQHVDVSLAPGVVGAPPATGVLLPDARATMSETPTGAHLTLAPVPLEEQRLLRSAIAERRHLAPNRRPCPPATQLSGHVPID